MERVGEGTRRIRRSRTEKDRMEGGGGELKKKEMKQKLENLKG